MTKRFIIPTLAILALLAACTASPAATATSAPNIPVTGGSTPTMTVAGPGANGPATVMVGQTASLGSFLVDGNGMTLYLFTKDQPGISNCAGGCALLWPPLLTNGTPVAGTGVDASMIGTITRTDGTTQVTYNGWPLYTYTGDEAAGDTNGEGYGTFWFVITPAGMQR